MSILKDILKYFKDQDFAKEVEEIREKEPIQKKEKKSLQILVEDKKSNVSIKKDPEIKSFWDRQITELQAGKFWTEEIKKLKDNPLKQFEKAVNNFPFPSAFCKAAVALRSMIKTKKKEQQNYEKELALLYKIAAIDSFLFAIKYIQEIHLPAFNVVELIPKRVYESLKYDYKNLGYNSLPLLNQTDCKWLVGLWGEPDEHTTLIALHKDIWDKYVARLINREWKEHNKFLKSLGWKPISIENFLDSKRKIDEKLHSDES